MLEIAPDEVVKKRLDICSTCPFRVVTPLVHIGRCSVCGCLLAGKTKLLTQTCPKGKW
jgi:hypothetical protein